MASLLTMSALLAGCGGSEVVEETAAEEVATETKEEVATEAKEEIVISYPTYRCGTHVAAETEQALIDSFNEKYAGQYRVEVEELPGDTAYTDKMKVLASSNSLPDLTEAKDGVFELALANGQAVDLTPFLEADPEWAAEIGEAAIAANTIDGKVMSIASQNQLVSYFYNKEIFAEAGIEPATTWDEWMSNCEAIKAAGYYPLALMTGENSWTLQHIYMAAIATQSESGLSQASEYYPRDYNTSEFIAATEMIQTMLADYTTPDAIGLLYVGAMNNFSNGTTAILANGSWAIGDFQADPELYDKIGVANFPGNSCVESFNRGYIICTDDPDKQEAAVAFLKHKTGVEAQLAYLVEVGDGPLTDLVQLTDEQAAANPLLDEYMKVALSADLTFNTMSMIYYSNVINEEMPNRFPSLVSGDITAEEFAEYLTIAAEKNQE